MSTRMMLEVHGMHCAGCVGTVQRALQQVAGVEAVAVTLEPPHATLRTPDDFEADQLRQAVAAAGDYRLGDPVDSDARPDSPAQAEAPRESLYPLALIFGFIAGVTLLVAVRTGTYSLASLMNHFMAGFFIVFGFFKLLDLPGFVRTYRTYDLIAKALPGWGWAYPFVELLLGTSYLLVLAPIVTNVITLVLMLVGAVGVWIALANRQRIRCACLGTALNLPMTTVTLVEDIGMAAMAAGMLILAAI